MTQRTLSQLRVSSLNSVKSGYASRNAWLCHPIGDRNIPPQHSLRVLLMSKLAHVA